MNEVKLEQEWLPSASTMWLTRQCSGMPAMQQRLHREGMLLDLDSSAAQRGREGHEGIAGEEYDEEVVEESSVEEANALETSIYQDWVERIIGDERIGDPVREERVFGHVGIEPIFTAKPDLYVGSLDSPRGLVVDHKLGFEEVPAPEANIQIWTQVAALSETHGLSEVSGDVCQPAIWPHPRLTIFSGAFLNAVIGQVKGIALNAIYHPKLRPGVHCGACPARMGCMVGIAWANKQKEFAAEIEERIATLDPVKSDMVYDGLGSAIKILAAVKKLMVARKRQDQNFIPSHKWISGRRSVEDVPLAIERLVDEGISREAQEAAMNFSVSELDKLIKRHFGLNDQGAKERLGSILVGIIKTAESTLRKKSSKELTQ